MKNQTLISVVLDRSGSMSNIRKDMEGGFDSFISEQKKFTGDEVKVNLFQFDDKYEAVYINKDLSEVPSLDLVPRGWTALLDAIGKSISTVGESLSKLKEENRPARVVFVIITDGGENSSSEYNSKQIADQIKHQQDIYDWKFIFLGANQDSFAVAGNLNINKNLVMNFNPSFSGVHSLYASTASNMRSFRSGNTDGLNYTENQKIEANL